MTKKSIEKFLPFPKKGVGLMAGKNLKQLKSDFGTSQISLVSSSYFSPSYFISMAIEIFISLNQLNFAMC